MSDLTCLTAEQLAAFSLGKLAGVDLDAVARHLDSCQTCQQTLHNLKPQPDTLVSALREPAVDAFADEPACREAVAQVEGLAVGGTRPISKDAGPGWPIPQDAGSGLPGLALTGQLGRYQILQQVGRGGMGMVYKAVHTLLKKTVALKVLPAERLANPQAVARFRREMEAVGRLDHPNIVRAFDADEANGVHFLAIEWVEGTDLMRYARQLGPLPVEQACELVRQAAVGLQHAHEHGLVHRDVKPSNLMATPAGQVKVLDLGLALLGGEQPAGEELTGSGMLMGTFDYIAPEQTDNAHAVDHRADIYSLGCTLYHLLTGSVPFPGGSTMQKAVAHRIDQPRQLAELRPDIPAELVAVVARMMAKSPADRYPTMADVAAALKPFTAAEAMTEMASLPLPAPAPEPPTRSCARAAAPRKRQRLLLPVAAAVLLILAPLGWWFGPAVVRIAANKGVLVIEADDPDVEVIVKGQGGRIIDRKGQRELELTAGDYEVEVRELPDGLRFATKKLTLVRGGKEIVIARLELAKVEKPPLPPPDGGKLVVGPVEQPGGEPLSSLALVSQPVRIKGVLGWTIETRAHRHIVRAVAYHPNGRHLASGSEDGTIRIWDAETGHLVRALLGHDRGVYALAWSRDGKILATGDEGKMVYLWNTESGQILRKLGGHTSIVTGIAWSPDGKTLASADVNRSVKLWNGESGELLRTVPANDVNSVAWSPDGKMLATGSKDRTVRLWDVVSGAEIRKLEGHKHDVTAVAWSSDGKTVASVSLDKTVKLWSIGGDPLVRTLEGNRGELWSLAWLPDGKSLFSGGDGFAVLWHADTGKKVWDSSLNSKGRAYGVACAPNGSTIAVGFSDQQDIQLVDAPSGKVVRTLGRNPNRVHASAWSPHLPALVLHTTLGNLLLWKFQGEPTVTRLADRINTTGFSLSPDGQALANGARNGSLEVWDVPRRQRRQTLVGQEADIWRLAWSPDGKKLASGSTNGTTFVWDWQTGKALHVMDVKSPVYGDGLAWSPDGKSLAIGATGRKPIRVWVPESGESREVMPLHRDAVTALAWSPDGKLLVSGSYNDPLHLLDPQSGKLLGELSWRANNEFIQAIAWLPDGKTLRAVDTGGFVHSWHTGTRQNLGHVRGPRDHARFSPDARLVASATSGAVRVWEAATGRVALTFALLPGDMHLTLGPQGHYHGSPEVERELVFVVQTANGQETLTPEEFAKKYSWKNDPDRARLVHSPREPVPASPLDRLDPKAIPAAERFDWQPKELVAVLGQHRARHWGQGISVDFSPDGKRVASIGQDGIRLWDAATMRELAVLPGSQAPWAYGRVKFSPDGRLLASGHYPDLLLWDLTGPEPKRRYTLKGHARTVQAMAFAPDGKTLASAGGDGGDAHEVILWDVGTGQQRTVIKKAHRLPVGQLAFCRAGKGLLSASNDGILALWDLSQGEPKRSVIMDGGCQSAAFAPERNLVAVTTAGRLRLWDVSATGPKEAESFVLENRKAAPGLWLSPDGRTLLAQWEGSDKPIIWRQLGDQAAPRFGRVDVRAPGWDGTIFGVAFAPDGKALVTGGPTSAVRLWDVGEDRLEERQPTLGHAVQAASLAFLPDGSALVSGGMDWTARVWDLTRPEPRERSTLRLERNDLPDMFRGNVSVALAPDGRTLATAAGAVTLWDLDGPEPKRRGVLAGHKDPAMVVAFAPRGQLLAVGSSDGLKPTDVRLWDLTGPEPREHMVLKGHRFNVVSLAFSEDGKYLASGGQDQTTRIWDLATGRDIHTLRHEPTVPFALAFSPDSKLLVTGGSNGARIWDVATGQQGRLIGGQSWNFRSAAFTPDGKALITSGNIGSTLWDVATGKVLQEWRIPPNHPTIIWAIALAPDGRHLATANANGTIYILRLRPSPRE